jgi:HEAT repeat protein
MNRTLFFALALSTCALEIFGQQPKTINTQMHSTPFAGGLSATVERFQQSNGPLWVGYQVEALPRTHLSACSSWTGSSQVDDGCCHAYRLEESGDNLNATDAADAVNPVIYVLLRLDHGAVGRVRLVPVGCTVNAGGLALEWLTGVQPEDSVAFLGKNASRAAKTSSDKSVDESLVALSVHATPKATEVLASLAAPSNSAYLREKAAFWLGAQRGHDGLLALQKLVREENDPELRKKLAFDISIDSDPGGVDELIRMAKSDTDSDVRGQALFWLAQKAGKKAISALKESMANDPDFAVKKKAVFALSQLPKDESVPQLIQVANTNSNAAVRKEAIFWLGQTNDPRALAYLEDMLKR